jgi:hypothetical protein
VSVNKPLTVYLILTLAATNGGHAVAAGRPPLTADDLAKAQECLAQDDNLLRLTCYDAAMHRPAKREAPEQNFGLSAAVVVAKEQLVVPPKSMTAVVVAVEHLSQGGIILTLANQQVWADQDSDAASFLIKAGDSVTVTPGAMGAYLLTGSESRHRSIRVKRLK